MTESEKKKKTTPQATPPAPRKSLHFQIPRSVTLTLCILLVVPYLVAVGYFLARAQSKPEKAASQGNSASSEASVTPTAKESVTSEKAQMLRPGPWGDVEYVPLFIECPDDYLSARTDENAERRWFFGGFSAEQLKTFVSSIQELSSEQKQQFIEAKTETVPNGLYVTPPPQLVLGLNPEARKKIYSFLTQYVENSWQQEAYVIPKETFDTYFKDSGLPHDTINLVRKLCYSYGKVFLFADIPYVLDTLSNFDQKKALEKAVSRRSSLMLRLRVDSHTDLNSLVRYWARAGTSKDLEPLLQSLAKVPDGEHINIALLLPPMPASRLYTYPYPSFSQPENCHWTTFNFFRDPPDNRFSDLKFLREKLDSEYYPMFTDPRYGDLVFLTKPNGDIVHSAVFIADDVVYTKNGGHFSAPWLLMRLPELVESYSTFVKENEALKVVYYRNKYF